jgi:hypothetical protein
VSGAHGQAVKRDGRDERDERDGLPFERETGRTNDDMAGHDG